MFLFGFGGKDKVEIKIKLTGREVALLKDRFTALKKAAEDAYLAPDAMRSHLTESLLEIVGVNAALGRLGRAIDALRDNSVHSLTEEGSIFHELCAFFRVIIDKIAKNHAMWYSPGMIPFKEKLYSLYKDVNDIIRRVISGEKEFIQTLLFTLHDLDEVYFYLK